MGGRKLHRSAQHLPHHSSSAINTFYYNFSYPRRHFTTSLSQQAEKSWSNKNRWPPPSRPLRHKNNRKKWKRTPNTTVITTTTESIPSSSGTSSSSTSTPPSGPTSLACRPNPSSTWPAPTSQLSAVRGTGLTFTTSACRLHDGSSSMSLLLLQQHQHQHQQRDWFMAHLLRFGL